MEIVLNSTTDDPDDKLAKHSRQARGQFFVMALLLVLALGLTGVGFVVVTQIQSKDNGMIRQFIGLNDTHFKLIDRFNVISATIHVLSESVVANRDELKNVASAVNEQASGVEDRAADKLKSLKDDAEKRLEDLRSDSETRYKEFKKLIQELHTTQAPWHPPQAARDYQHPEQQQQAYSKAPEEKDPLDDLDEDERNAKRLEKVKEAFTHSWKAYKKFAWGKDELTPMSMSGKNWGNGRKGIGLTIFDSLSALHLMGMYEDFEEAVEFIIDVDFDQPVKVSPFESTIRIVGSILSAYELSGEKNRKLLRLAERVAGKLLWAYNTSTGIPHSTINLQTHKHWCPAWTRGSAVLAEFATVQLEMRTLSYHTKNPIYDMKATHIMSILKARAPADWLCPTYMDTETAQWQSDHITVGALGDSFYEYLLKQYLLTGKTEEHYKEWTIKALEGMCKRMLMYSEPSRQAYIAELKHGMVYHKMDHLACFVAGMFALAADEIGGEHKEKYLRIGGEIADTCWQTYDKSNTGIGPEIVEFHGGGDFSPGSRYYILRPEALEAQFYMWRVTKDQKYRDRAWKMFRAINRWCRVETGGYVGIRDVYRVPPIQDDLMQSFWMAETLKYLFLIFSEDEVLDFKKWVLNTEGQPLRIRKRDPLDIWREWETAHDDMPWVPPTVDGVNDVETEDMKKRRERSGNRRVVAPRDPNSLFDDEDYEAAVYGVAQPDPAIKLIPPPNPKPAQRAVLPSEAQPAPPNPNPTDSVGRDGLTNHQREQLRRQRGDYDADPYEQAAAGRAPVYRKRRPQPEGDE